MISNQVESMTQKVHRACLLLKRWIHPVDCVAVVVADSSQGMDQLHLEELSSEPALLESGSNKFWKEPISMKTGNSS